MNTEVAHLVGDDGALPLPWLVAPLADVLRAPRGHALLVHGAPGVGAMAFALTLAQAWLCEADATPRLIGPCGRCGSCRLVQSHLHPDLQVVMPETLRRAHRWPLADDKPEGEDKRKASKQIRIDDVRGLIDWSTRTSARGRGKVGVLHPAEALNLSSASALLKTLEEPPPGTRLLLTCADPIALLPTVRSRCQRLRLQAPPAEMAVTWLAQHGVAQPEVLLAACSGRPLDALELAQAGVDAAAWSALPMALAQGQPAALAGWPVPRALDALQKLCHDALAHAVGGAARFFPGAQMPQQAEATALLAWSQDLQRVMRHAEHPWNEALLLDALVREAAAALSQPRPTAARSK
ncbi:MAG: DNA polymerase III subunit delta' [Pseudomonadota bacterium]|nr:DNA polymerase III subunit delta' [Pseudomonadota bacterium]